MSVNIDRTASADLPDDFDLQAIADGLLALVMQRFGSGRVANVDLLICDPEAIRDLNRCHRGIDRETDVLSFPNLEFDSPGMLPALTVSDFDPETGDLMLGSIALNVDRAYRQAEEYGHSARRECAFLIAHSLLHLAGYDHETDADASVMEKLQEELLGEMDIKRD